MQPSKTGWPSLNVVIFPPVLRLVLDDQKRFPEIINQIQDLILGDRRILTKSVFEQLGISRKRVGSNIHEDLDIPVIRLAYVIVFINTYKLQINFDKMVKRT
jgi:hypothetical protein